MDEYIDREALIADIDEEIEQDSKMYTREQNYYIEKGLRIARKDIQSAPAADVAEVKHGEWVAVPSSDMATGKAYKCSECKKMRYGARLPPYCQECGAKMDGKENADNAECNERTAD